LEKLRATELELLPDKPTRRTSKQVLYDKRWKTKSELPQYLSLFFIVYQADILTAGHKWKDLILDVIIDREAGIEVYNSLYIPEDNIE
jgi:hypothetical protein